MAIDLSQLYSGATGSLNPNAPPIFRRGDITFNQANPGQELESGGRVGASDAGWSSPFGTTDNMYINGTDPNSPTVSIKNGQYAGMSYNYGLDPTGQYYIAQGPGQQRQMGTANYGADVWMPAAMTIGGYFGGGAAFGGGEAGAGGALGAGVDATGGAETAIGGSSYGGAGGYGAAGLGSAPVGTGSSTTGITGTGGGSSSGSGLLSSIKPGDAIQLGGLLGGAIGGGNRGPQGQPAQRAPVYADPNQQLSMLPYQPAPQVQPPQYGSANRPASEIWQQYASGLFNRGYQPPSVPGVYGMTRGGYGGFLSPQMRPVGMPPGGGLLQPQPPANAQPVQRSPSEGY